MSGVEYFGIVPTLAAVAFVALALSAAAGCLLGRRSAKGKPKQ